jgi:hypothetical protein
MTRNLFILVTKIEQWRGMRLGDARRGNWNYDRLTFARKDEQDICVCGNVIVFIIASIEKNWEDLDMTVEESLKLLETLGTIRIQLTKTDFKPPSIINRVPEPRKDIRQPFSTRRHFLPRNSPSQQTNHVQHQKDNKKFEKI